MRVRRVWMATVTLALAMTAVGVMPAAAQTAPAFDPSQIVFPVIGPVHFIDDFLSPRGSVTHGATDIMSDAGKGLPVVAAADGVVSWIGTTCCYLSIDHGGGYETWYIHLNNDTPGTDDGKGWGIAPGIERGVKVVKGQLIGWVGDSGNAEWTAPHLHFEIRKDNVPINPYPYLLAAPRLTEPGGTWVGQFRDDDGSVHEANIEKVFAAGITKGCNAAQDRFCPLDELTRGEIAAFIARALNLPASPQDFFADDTGNQFAASIDAITQAGIGFGCDVADPTRFCPDQPITRAEMAEMLVRAFSLPAATTDYFNDDAGNRFEASINALREANITNGCDPNDPARFCPDSFLTRGEMASFFARAMKL